MVEEEEDTIDRRKARRNAETMESSVVQMEWSETLAWDETLLDL